MNVAIKYPITPTSIGKMELIDESTAIKQSISSILGTPKGTRFMLENYGSDCERLTFEPNDDILKSLLSYFIADSLLDWEKRIQVITVQFEDFNENQINAYVIYKIKKKNVIDSYVYPFYKEIKY